jgi:hypothetical protein
MSSVPDHIGPEVHPVSYSIGTGFLQAGKTTVSLSTSEVTNRFDLYLVIFSVPAQEYHGVTLPFTVFFIPVFLNGRAAASIIPGRTRISWNLSF